jgi:hypothetical protein
MNVGSGNITTDMRFRLVDINKMELGGGYKRRQRGEASTAVFPTIHRGSFCGFSIAERV